MPELFHHMRSIFKSVLTVYQALQCRYKDVTTGQLREFIASRAKHRQGGERRLVGCLKNLSFRLQGSASVPSFPMFISNAGEDLLLANFRVLKAGSDR